MAGYKSVIELLAEQLAEALERIEVLEAELARLEELMTPERAAEIMRSAMGPKQ